MSAARTARPLAAPADLQAFAAEANREIVRAQVPGDTLEAQVRAYLALTGTRLGEEDAARLVAAIDDRRRGHGYGPLAGLMADDAVTDIAVDRWDTVHVLRAGSAGWERVPSVSFASEADLVTVIRHLLNQAGQGINREDPIVDAGLDDVRMAALLPPAVASPALTLRKRRLYHPNLRALTRGDAPMLDYTTAYLLSACTLSRLNVLVSGGTGSGKTTLLAALLDIVPDSERVVVIEDNPELESRFLPGPGGLPKHIRFLRANEDAPALGADELLRASLRQAPDRIVVGEVRGREALTFVRSLNTGHEGSLCSIHANSPADAVSRLATACLDHPSRPPFEVVEAQIGAALHLLVQLSAERAENGRRVVAEVAEVVWAGGATVTTRTLLRYEAGRWRFLERPSFWPRIASAWGPKPDPWSTP